MTQRRAERACNRCVRGQSKYCRDWMHVLQAALDFATASPINRTPLHLSCRDSRTTIAYYENSLVSSWRCVGVSSSLARLGGKPHSAAAVHFLGVRSGGSRRDASPATRQRFWASAGRSSRLRGWTMLCPANMPIIRSPRMRRSSTTSKLGSACRSCRRAKTRSSSSCRPTGRRACSPAESSRQMKRPMSRCSTSPILGGSKGTKEKRPRRGAGCACSASRWSARSSRTKTRLRGHSRTDGRAAQHRAAGA